jgi:hypothetical protein
MMNEDYADVVDALHDAALAIEADADLKINALINVAVEAALAHLWPEEGGKLLFKILKRHAEAAEIVRAQRPPRVIQRCVDSEGVRQWTSSLTQAFGRRAGKHSRLLRRSLSRF